MTRLTIKSVLTPLQITMLIHAYCIREPYGRHHEKHRTSPAVREGWRKLAALGLIRPVDEVWEYEATPKGIFLVQHYCETPIPIESYSIPV